MVQIKIKLNGGIMPKKGSKDAAAYDVYVPNDVTLKCGRQIIDLKFSMELPHLRKATIKPRSGFSSKGIEVQYCVIDEWGTSHIFDSNYRIDADVLIGTIDEDYRGSVGAIIDVHRPIMEAERMVIKGGTRIAQMCIEVVPDTELMEVDNLDMTNDRGGGFGHTGTK